MANNFDKYASTPEKTARTLCEFRFGVGHTPALRSYRRFLGGRDFDPRVKEEELVLEWLMEECE